jgi:hypothetical protein
MREKEREREREEEEREVIYSKIWRNNSWPSWERDGISRQRHASDRLEKEKETNKSSFSASCDLIIDRRDRETDRQTSKETGKQTDRPQKGEGRTMKRRQRERERNRARDTDRERERERERERKKPKKRERDREREKSAKSERHWTWPQVKPELCWLGLNEFAAALKLYYFEHVFPPPLPLKILTTFAKSVLFANLYDDHVIWMQKLHYMKQKAQKRIPS